MFIAHGSAVSLFHRQHQSTTRHLCVSRSKHDAQFKTDEQVSASELGQLQPSCFLASSQYWDPFLIYLVDPTQPSPPLAHTSTNRTWPPPPPNALPVPPSSATPQLIMYNPPLVLQCLTTGVVSPTMLFRRAGKGSKVFGGFSAVSTSRFSSFNAVPSSAHYVGAQQYGRQSDTSDSPVLQMHRLALERYKPLDEVSNDPKSTFVPNTYQPQHWRLLRGYG